MKRSTTSIVLNDEQITKLHHFFDYSISLVGHKGENLYSQFEELHAFGAREIISADKDALSKLQTSIDKQKDWHFGILSYDLKNQIELLHSNNHSKIQFPDLLFFIPKYVITKQSQSQNYILHYFKNDLPDLQSIINTDVELKEQQNKFQLKPRITKQEYFEKFGIIQNHIQLGDIYEINFCQEFYQNQVNLNPYQIFERIRQKAKSPFMAFAKAKNLFLLSASPERYILKKGNRIISQPIKGTARRGSSPKEDQLIQTELSTNLKEQTENVMIVDLVRNDLGKCCDAGSVEVTELYKLYTYPTVHQLISTIEGDLKQGINFQKIIENTFPMGSMTGAPKIRVMEVIEQVEENKRGWYSGAVGYIHPEGNFDFNVIIRSFLYDELQKYLSFSVGGAITASSDVEKEYEECLVKLHSLLQLMK